MKLLRGNSLGSVRVGGGDVACSETLIIVRHAWKKSFELSGESKHKLGGKRANQLFQKAVVRCRVRDTGYEDKFTFRFGKTLVETR